MQSKSHMQFNKFKDKLTFDAYEYVLDYIIRIWIICFRLYNLYNMKQMLEPMWTNIFFFCWNWNPMKWTKFTSRMTQHMVVWILGGFEKFRSTDCIIRSFFLKKKKNYIIQIETKLKVWRMREKERGLKKEFWIL